MLNYFFKKFIIKEKACYVGLYFEEELKIVEPFDYESPNGTHIIVKDQRIRCHKALFKPAMIGKKEMVLVKLAMTLFKNVILVLEKIYTIVSFYRVVILCIMDYLKDLLKKLKPWILNQ